MLFGGTQNSNQTTDSQEDVEIEKKRQDVERKLAAGLLEDEIVSIEVTEQQSSMFDMLQGTGMEQMGMNFQDALGSFMPKTKRKLSVKEARKVLTNEEAQRLIDMDEVTQEAVYRAEQLGIILSMKLTKLLVSSRIA